MDFFLQVLNFKKTLSFPLDKDVSFFAISIIKSLLVKEKKRLGARGISEVQDHLWFQKLDWGKLGDDSVSRPITLRETERFYRGTEGNLSVPASLVRRGSGGRESIQSEDSDEEFMDDLLMMLSAGTSSDESSKYGTSIDRKPSNMSMIRGRIKRPPQSRKDAYTKELTYGQRLLAWFTGNNVDGVDSPK
ncbi:hypothetical protein BaRGS_00018584 [Batillaria attramentaria]|uniref:AGC-kinase C-terminal domain-containing protein n=1 Tax=Batillaria attramentaria TaxID=370345 RepID=A0ABD0KTK0_9CAEN